MIIPLLALAALVGFLFYNRPPARIIMGDTGALGLGAALGALALDFAHGMAAAAASPPPLSSIPSR